MCGAIRHFEITRACEKLCLEGSKRVGITDVSLVAYLAPFFPEQHIFFVKSFVFAHEFGQASQLKKGGSRSSNRNLSPSKRLGQTI
jgi:hypothetical protein